MSNQPPRDDQGHRLLGPAALRTCPFASLLSQVQARLGPGGYCRCSGNGGPRTCLPAACGVAQAEAQYGPSSSTQAQDPREGPSLVGWTMQGFLRGGLTRQAHEEAERSRQGVPREVLVTQAMTIETRRAPGGRRPTQCPCFLFGAKGASTDVEYRGIRQRLPFQCNETKTGRAVGWRSPWSPRRRHRQCLWQPKTNFSQDNLY